jgi:hypothetical protein
MNAATQTLLHCRTDHRRIRVDSPGKNNRRRLRVELKEADLQRRVKQAGGKWNRERGAWEISYDQAIALGLKKRIVKLD